MYTNMYENSSQNKYFKNFIDREIKTSPKYPINETEGLLRYFDNKDSKTFEFLIIFITALIGGIAGALITVIFN